ncbi:hypothetical protein ANANG_G00176790 [Anguilla anguilla]|uniref:Uncharacterized protein n=1 Tax=Anguilla anguilla TaxID=7936 RepID=A0A9D3M4I2_ANGAN|nr:hypothetical protein ANANG_G00176790 [Anguilla anguilla]
MFYLQTTKNSSYIMRCLLCLPRNVDISAYKNSTSNLRKYVALPFLLSLTWSYSLSLSLSPSFPFLPSQNEMSPVSTWCPTKEMK